MVLVGVDLDVQPKSIHPPLDTRQREPTTGGWERYPQAGTHPPSNRTAMDISKAVPIALRATTEG